MEPIRSFDRYFSGKSIVRPVTSEQQVREAFEEAKRDGRRVVIRGAGHSFHDKALHHGDTGNSLILSAGDFQKGLIEFKPELQQVRLGIGNSWGEYLKAAGSFARDQKGPMFVPASIMTGRNSTVGGTLSGDCLSRFSGTMGKESHQIVSFRLLTTEGNVIDVSKTSHPDLFDAVVGGLGYIGFVMDATYKMVPIDRRSVAHTLITIHYTFDDLVQKQLELARQYDGMLRGISSAWFTEPGDEELPIKIKGAVFDSWYDVPGVPRRRKFPLYDDIDSDVRYWTEVLARDERANYFAHEALYRLIKLHPSPFENRLRDFIFFMDGNTFAKEKYERETKRLFPIIQQTFIIPVEQTVHFAENCELKLRAASIRPTESDMLYIKRDHCLMSGNYELDGFAVTFTFELMDDEDPKPILTFLEQLTDDCLTVGGRLHLIKNVFAPKASLRAMYSPQIQQFEEIKRRYDPSGTLQNTFSERIFDF